MPEPTTGWTGGRRAPLAGTDRVCTIAVVVGVRPNLPKVRSLLRGLDRIHRCDPQAPVHRTLVIHSGQHYDPALGRGFAAELGLPVDMDLGEGGSGPRGLPALLAALGTALSRVAPGLLVVVGDVDTTVAAALVGSRQNIPVVHLEAGLRAGPQDPEEARRKIVTACSGHHLAPSDLAASNLAGEGVDRGRVHAVGNTMAESFLLAAPERARCRIVERLGLTTGSYVLVTAHKPEMLEDIGFLEDLLRALARRHTVVFAAHPRTRQVLRRGRLDPGAIPGVRVVPPVSYVESGSLVARSAAVVTDSSGLQEEATVAGVRCVTILPYTARPETVLSGTNIVTGPDVDRCLAALAPPSARLLPRLWDTHVSERLARTFAGLLRGVDGDRAPMDASRWSA